jgi:thiosulfate dehydrogenase [quinone] large subunit
MLGAWRADKTHRTWAAPSDKNWQRDATCSMRNRMGGPMTEHFLNRGITFYLRVAVGWTFLYAGLSQVTNPDFTVTSFLSHTKTFHDVLSIFALPAIAPIMSFLVSWGHTLIGLSLISGLMVRISVPFGMALMGIYYLAHMDFPYIETNLNFLIDYHVIYVGVLAYLMLHRAGHVWGLDGWFAELPFVTHNPVLRPLVG